MRKLEKNFTYGDIWTSPIITDENGRVEKIEPEKVTKNQSFVKWIYNNGYTVLLDHSGFRAVGQYGGPGIAVTKPDRKEIVLNGNYSKRILSSLLHHEMGHLILFSVDQFRSIGKDTIRSMIAKYIYTPSNIKTYGMPQLLRAENIIQDIIIETLSGEACLCSSVMSEHHHNIGVKHLDSIEGFKSITKEALTNILVKEEAVELSELPSDQLKQIEEIVESMNEELLKDIDDIELEKDSNSVFEEFLNNLIQKEGRKIDKLEATSEKLERRLNTAKSDELREKLLDALEKIQEEIADLKSDERLESLEYEAKKMQESKLKTLQRYMDKDEELRDELKSILEEISEELKRRESDKSGHHDEAAEEDDANSDMTYDGLRNAGENVEGKGYGKESDYYEKSGDLNEGEPFEKDSSIIGNNEDHHGVSEEGDSSEDSLKADGKLGHSYDCGFPHPISVTREQSIMNQSTLLKVNGKVNSRRVIVKNDVGEDFEGGRKKSFEKNLTYFKSAKKEFDNTDMMKGKRKKFKSGVNVLVGLDISGSMSSEWTKMFNELSEFVRSLKGDLDIESIHYFTYESSLVQHSSDISDLKLSARGGNAFPQVYQQVMEFLPVQAKNELILVTDCGDNLGFDLSRICQVEKDGEEVESHITVIDTENAGFIHLENVEKDDWSFLHYADGGLKEKIKENIEKLIERS